MRSASPIVPARSLDRADLLSELPRDLCEGVQTRLRHRALGEGEILAVEGEPCPGLCLVEKGLIKIYKMSAAGREQVLLLARPGDSFADAPAFTGDAMPASVMAVEPSVVRILPIADLNQLLDTEPRFARAIIRHLSRQLQHVVGLVEDLSFRHVQARVAKVLLQASHPRDGIGAGVGRRPLTHRDIAEMAGTAREVVSRTVGAFESQGLIRTDQGRITVVDPAGLEALL